MHQRVRCPECRHWTDALLVWASGDCCPACNAPIVDFSRPDRPVGTSDDPLRPAGRFSQPRRGRSSDRPINDSSPINR